MTDQITQLLHRMYSVRLVRFAFVLLAFLTPILLATQSQLAPPRQADVDKLAAYRELPFAPERYDFLRSYLESRPQGDTSHVLGQLLHWYSASALDFGRRSVAFEANAESMAIHARDASTPEELGYLALSHYLRYQLTDGIERTELGYSSLNMADSIWQTLGSPGEVKYERRRNGIRFLRVTNAVIQNDFDLALAYIDILQNADPKFVPDYIREASGDGDRAWVYYTAGESQRVIETLERVFAGERGPYSEFLRRGMLTNLSVAYRRTGQYDKAEAALREVTALAYEECPEGVGNFYNCDNYVSTFVSGVALAVAQEQEERAESLYHEGLELANRVYQDYSSSVRSELHLQAAKNALLQLNYPLAERRFQLSLNDLLIDTSQIEPVSKLPIIRDLSTRSTVDLIRWLSERFKYEQSQNEPVHDQRALRVHRKIDSLLYSTWQQNSFNEPLYTNNPTVRQHYERALNYCQQRFLQTDSSYYLTLAYETVSRTKGDVLRRRLAGGNIAAAAGIPQSRLNQREEIRTRLAVLEYELSEQTDDKTLRDSLSQYETALRATDQAIATEYAKFSSLLDPPPIPNTTSFTTALPDDQVVIDYFLGKDSIHVVCLDATREVTYYRLPGSAEVQASIADILTNPTAATRVRALLLDPLLAELPAGIDRLQIIPDGPLWNIPFAALPDENGRYLIEDYALSTAYSVQTLAQSGTQTRSSASRPIAAYGITYSDISAADTLSYAYNRDEDIQPLPLAAQEANEVARLLKGIVHLDRSVTSASLLGLAKDARVLHLAVHGSANELNPFRSSLILAAGGEDSAASYVPFTLKDIISGSFSNDLVVLSACHTQFGPLVGGQGINSLARGFRMSGARSILASHWEVNDRAAYALMTEFYRALATGEPTDRALQQATIAYLASAPPEFSDPFYWANLVLVGVTEPVVHTSWLARNGWWVVIGLLVPAFVGWYAGRRRSR